MYERMTLHIRGKASALQNKFMLGFWNFVLEISMLHSIRMGGELFYIEPFVLVVEGDITLLMEPFGLL